MVLKEAEFCSSKAESSLGAPLGVMEAIAGLRPVCGATNVCQGSFATSVPLQPNDQVLTVAAIQLLASTEENILKRAKNGSIRVPACL